MSPNNPEFNGFNQEVSTELLEAPKPPAPPPFSVKSRSRAQKLAKLLYGPFARVWVNRSFNQKIAEGFSEEQVGTVTFQREVGICVGTEQGDQKLILSGGKDFSTALRLGVETYVKGGVDYDDTKKRLLAVSNIADAQEFTVPALEQFPEYKEERARTQEKVRAMLKKGAKQHAQAVS